MRLENNYDVIIVSISIIMNMYINVIFIVIIIVINFITIITFIITVIAIIIILRLWPKLGQYKLENPQDDQSSGGLSAQRSVLVGQ